MKTPDAQIIPVCLGSNTGILYPKQRNDIISNRYFRPAGKHI